MHSTPSMDPVSMKSAAGLALYWPLHDLMRKRETTIKTWLLQVRDRRREDSRVLSPILRKWLCCHCFVTVFKLSCHCLVTVFKLSCHSRDERVILKSVVDMSSRKVCSREQTLRVESVSFFEREGGRDWCFHETALNQKQEQLCNLFIIETFERLVRHWDKECGSALLFVSFVALFTSLLFLSRFFIKVSPVFSLQTSSEKDSVLIPLHQQLSQQELRSGWLLDYLITWKAFFKEKRKENTVAVFFFRLLLLLLLLQSSSSDFVVQTREWLDFIVLILSRWWRLWFEWEWEWPCSWLTT